MTIQHAAIWLGPARARVLQFEDQCLSRRDGHATVELQPADAAGSDEDGEGSATLFDRVCASVHDVPDLLLTGSAAAIGAFERHVAARPDAVLERVRGVQVMEAPCDRRLAMLARWHFLRPEPALAPAGF